jgi:hypothetical protein
MWLLSLAGNYGRQSRSAHHFEMWLKSASVVSNVSS